MSESGLLHLVASVQDVLSKPHEGDRIRDLKALAAELKHTQQNSTSPMEGPLRWVANMAAALLLTQGMALQPANAGDVVNYSDFIDSVNKGDVEMVRVQPDMLSAQYVTKEGARREVNLIPNGQIEDQLFNQLADKKAWAIRKCQATFSSPLYVAVGDRWQSSLERVSWVLKPYEL